MAGIPYRSPTILIVDDETDVRSFLREALEIEGLPVLEAANGEEAIHLADEHSVGIIILDLQMPVLAGLAVLRRLKLLDEPPTVIMLTGHGTVESATEAMKLGAFDFLTKPVDHGQLVNTVRDALAERERISRPGRDLVAGREEPLIVGASLREVLVLLDQAAATELPIVLTGETGTGKELFAVRLHCRSRRAAGNFLALNCAAMPEALIDGELFGHEKGAFTGADARKLGLFEAASGGTLFLDEIAELPASAQSSLLRVVETGELRRVGGTANFHVNVRLIAASSQSLQKLVEEGTFREDLYYRLHGIEIPIPPLRERPEDLPELVEHFLGLHYSKTGQRRALSVESMNVLRSHHWPGNIRELRQVIERAAALADGENIGPEALRLSPSYTQRERRPSQVRTLADLEKDYILEVVRRQRGNVSAAARALEIPRNTLYRRLKRYGYSSPTGEQTRSESQD